MWLESYSKIRIKVCESFKPLMACSLISIYLSKGHSKTGKYFSEFAKGKSPIWSTKMLEY